MKRFTEHRKSPPPPLTEERRKEITREGLRRRAAYIEKHPFEPVNPAISGWDEPLVESKKRRRKRK